jgi:hypothetical protein
MKFDILPAMNGQDGLAQLPDWVDKQHPGTQPAPGHVLFTPLMSPRPGYDW